MAAGNVQSVSCPINELPKLRVTGGREMLFYQSERGDIMDRALTKIEGVDGGWRDGSVSR